jgi:hypothetical protein
LLQLFSAVTIPEGNRASLPPSCHNAL